MSSYLFKQAKTAEEDLKNKEQKKESLIKENQERSLKLQANAKNVLYDHPTSQGNADNDSSVKADGYNQSADNPGFHGGSYAEPSKNEPAKSIPAKILADLKQAYKKNNDSLKKFQRDMNKNQVLAADYHNKMTALNTEGVTNNISGSARSLDVFLQKNVFKDKDQLELSKRSLQEAISNKKAIATKKGNLEKNHPANALAKGGEKVNSFVMGTTATALTGGLGTSVNAMNAFGDGALKNGGSMTEGTKNFAVNLLTGGAKPAKKFGAVGKLKIGLPRNVIESDTLPEKVINGAISSLAEKGIKKLIKD